MCKVLGGVSDLEFVSEGADPDCSLTDNGALVSWIQKDSKTELWTIHLSTFESDLRSLSTILLLGDIANLTTRPYITQFQGEPCLIYLNMNRGQQTEIHTYFIRSHRSFTEKLAIESPNDMIVKCSEDLVMAAIDSSNDFTLLRLDGENWKQISKIPKNSMGTGRFDFAVRKDISMFVIEKESQSEQGVDSLVVDLSNGTFEPKSTICDYGRFPSVTAAPDCRWLISWVGSPAHHLDTQERNQSLDDSRSYIDVLNEIRAESEAKGTNSKTSFEERSEMERIWDVNYVPPWAPLWLGVISDTGQCDDTYGPLGGGVDENFDTHLSFHSNRGILMWLSRDRHAKEGEAGCSLKAREIVFS